MVPVPTLTAAFFAFLALSLPAIAQDWNDSIGRVAAEAADLFGAPLSQARGGPAIMAMDPLRGPGEWGATTLQATHGGPRGIGTHNEDGVHLLLDCVGTDGIPTFYVGPLSDPPAQAQARAVVSLSDGLLIFAQNMAFEQVETGYLMAVIDPYLAWNLQDGGRFELFFDDDAPMTFLLLESRTVIEGERPCDADRILPGAFAGHPALVLTGAWAVESRIVDFGETPVLAFPALPPLGPEVLVTCDGRLTIPSVLPGVPPYGLRLTIHSTDASPFIADTTLSQGRVDLATPPLSPQTLAAMAGGAFLDLTLVSADADLLPTTIRMGLLGAEALEDLSCPAGADDDPLDLTDSDAGWARIDASSEGDESLLAAQFDDDRAPPLMIDCAGRPFFETGSLPFDLDTETGLDLTLSVDGGPPLTRNFVLLREFVFPGTDVAALGPDILDGLTLRISAAGGFDILYPLIGVQAALDGITCGV